MRTCGNFEGTLEYIIISYLLEQDYSKEENDYLHESLCRLETGCSGVYPLMKISKKSKIQDKLQDLSITCTFLTLVHSTPNWNNGTISIPLNNDNDIVRN